MSSTSTDAHWCARTLDTCRIQTLDTVAFSTARDAWSCNPVCFLPGIRNKRRRFELTVRDGGRYKSRASHYARGRKHG